MKKAITLFLFLTIVFTGTGLFASNNTDKAPKAPAKTTVMSGLVSDAVTGEALAGALVEVEGTSIKVFTDLEGKYSISDLGTGTYNLKVKYISYEEKKITSVRANDEGDNLNITLNYK
ncbi:MAG: hypothetical protein CVT92_03870 [Bacteroidetes bacterium HGW-Bacteroidetes-1]|jgi:hypothetical protein|nr:MAG: hypothetical protein CVT92_03870 [Bacteroidetes bacterium HGW-Bacteroidetes-1]